MYTHKATMYQIGFGTPKLAMQKPNVRTKNFEEKKKHETYEINFRTHNIN